MVSKKALAIGATVTVVVVMVVVVVVVPSVLLTQKAEFRETFMKKCLEFPEEKDICERAWVHFEKAYVGKNPDTVTPDNYKELFDEFPFTYPCEKSLLWSKTSDLVKLVEKGKCYVPIGHTLLGYVLNGLIWCGKKNSPETFTDDTCVATDINPYISFWTMASIRYAQHTCKEVKVLLNGDVKDPYDTKSFLAESEVPYLEHPRVTKLDVILAVQKKGTQCNDESLKNLKNELKQKGIGYDCNEVLRSQLEKILNTC
ncbi:ADP-ribosyl cyclase/cyclic ADP-ribose hydrolase 1-like [Labrus mixtus]|uniref:ADP-ribosyl cyclase/cyclic ADP-ribose hydrolase 1-like n=1 Tax=Labrus mixtus TaxID=508554 RepID=UPI0029C025BE|nr:ADP-ribosyl cyclase/cyclic ADP-ribose hydrolase 1-like [Labrus mixtus]